MERTPESVHHGAQKLSDEELITDSNDEHEHDDGLSEVDERENLDEISLNVSSVGTRESKHFQRGLADLPKNLNLSPFHNQNLLGLS